MDRKAFFITGLALIAFLAVPAAASADSVYGQGVTLADTVSVDEVISSAEDFDGARAAVVGQVVDVCSVRGCWLELAGTDPNRVIRVQVEEGVVSIPADARGRSATVQGLVEVVEPSVIRAEACAGCPSARDLAGEKSSFNRRVRILATGVVIH